MTRCGLFGGLLSGVVSSASIGPAIAQDGVPAGFSLSEFATGLSQPTALAFAPDGRLFVAEKTGAIRIVDHAGLRGEPLVVIPVYDLSECGLLGLAVDPEFDQNGFLYAFATVSPDEQRILRITVEGDVAESVESLVDNLPTEGVNHDGGCLRVGLDDHLYFSIGDTGIPSLSQDMNTLAGKIGRVRLDGTVPGDNPFTTPTGSPRATYAIGFRNPFRFCFAGDGRLFVMDVGSNGDARREEVNLVAPGANHGWPEVEGIGDDSSSGFVNPIFAYHDEGQSIAGCAVYEGDALPAEFQGNLFHLDYVSNTLFRVALDGDGVASHQPFFQGEGGTVDLAIGPDEAFYYSELISGRVMRLAYVGRGGSNSPPDDPMPPSDEPDAPGVGTPRLCGGLGLGLLAFMSMALVGAKRCGVRRSPR